MFGSDELQLVVDRGLIVLPGALVLPHLGVEELEIPLDGFGVVAELSQVLVDTELVLSLQSWYCIVRFHSTVNTAHDD